MDAGREAGFSFAGKSDIFFLKWGYSQVLEVFKRKVKKRCARYYGGIIRPYAAIAKPYTGIIGSVELLL